jgi:hypothetical protein
MLSMITSGNPGHIEATVKRQRPYSISASVLIFAMGLSAVAACGDDSTTAGGGGAGNGPSTGGSGGGGGDGGSAPSDWPTPAPALRNPVDMPDADLAYQSLLLMGVGKLGATTTTCTECHDINNGLLEMWRSQTDAAVASCFADPTLPTREAAEAVALCMRMKANETSPFYTPKLGIYSAAAKLPWFDFLFTNLDETGNTYDDFITQVDMPKATTHWTQPEFDIVAEWFARGLPFLHDLLPDEPPVGNCDQNISPAVGEHIEAMKTQGWRAVNAANNLLMFGCAGAATTLDCLAAYDQAGDTAFGDGWEYMEGAKIRVLYTVDHSTSYWTRSSADGRYVAHGGSGNGGGSTVVDLQTETEIHVAAAYDPGFFPDNTGWMFQGTPGNGGYCPQSLLAIDNDINFQEPGCSFSGAVGLYQHIGAAPGGGDYWAVSGEFASDNGGHSPTLENFPAFFGGDSDIRLVPIVYNGTEFDPGSPEVKSTPNEGDTIMSPSSRLLMGRVAKSGWAQDGFRMRRVDATPAGNGYDVEVPEIARYCINGGKPAVSYDERWAVLHRYVEDSDAVELGFSGSADPAFQAYQQSGAANIYLLDLLTGITRRVTHMKPGQYALFPHFRSDGWIYFVVRQMSDVEYIVASDAALTLETE